MNSRPHPQGAEIPALGMGYGRQKGKEEGGEMKEIKPDVGKGKNARQNQD